MDILIKNLNFPKNVHQELSNGDILIRDGKITEIAPSIAPAKDDNLEILDAAGGYVSPGWVEIFSDFADPGYEFKEDLTSGAAAGFAGGFTHVFLLPSTHPVVDSKSQVRYIIEKAARLPIKLYPIGAISKGLEGRELSEMYDMAASGAIAFSDGKAPLQSAGLLLKALQYVKAEGQVLIQMPFDKTIGTFGLINEGITSTRLGLPGLPAIAEELMIQRDIELVRYTESKLHFTGIASKKSVDLIARAKKQGLPVTCSVTPHHLLFTDEDLTSYDTNLKVNPPLRTTEDREALREGVKNGVIDAIATQHFAEHADDKVREFEYAKNGMIGLQTTYSVLMEAMPDISPERVVELLSLGARSIFGLDTDSLKLGQQADLTIFHPTKKSTFTKAANKSKAANSPYFDRALKGKVLATISRNQITKN
ncbi:dihydroorotase [Arachidicoccus ginsenosidivorans]|uniref:Dihydroorotase n=1 Tax=Arachidicoccus ginsenosidivorans TaxID=496057 RepID=A0A5B8VQR0_9BACT|nr:dihydroorotase [Arachidicoccus ginsenosidivorans]QEC73232.1 dihydroorotase [Arachidicoccus ginsenosidivorans]